MSKERLASLIGRAVMDHRFAEEVQKNPEAAARSIGVHLTPDEIEAVKAISAARLTEVAKGLRDKLGAKAIFDQQQQQQQQARMD